MTDQTQTPPDAQHHQTAAQAEKIVREGGDHDTIREKIRALMVDTVKQRQLKLDQIKDTARAIGDGAVQGVRKASPANPDSVLRSVMNGIADGSATTLNAVTLAFQESAGSAKSFAKEEVDQTINDLKALEKQMTESLTRFATHARDQIKQQTSDLTEHARSLAQSVRPKIDAALKAAKDHPRDLIMETAAAGVEASRQTVGVLASTISGVLRGASDILADVSQKVTRDK